MVVVLGFAPITIFLAVIFARIFGAALWLMIIVPPWSSVIHPLLGQTNLVDQKSLVMFDLRLFGLGTALYFFIRASNRFLVHNRLDRRDMWFQCGGVAIAIPPFLKTYYF